MRLRTELRTKRGVKRWAPKSEAEKVKFQELVLCPRNDRDQDVLRDDDDDEGLVSQQERLLTLQPLQGIGTKSFFSEETFENVQCKLQCDVDATRDVNKCEGSLNVHSVLMGARTGHLDDL